MHPALGIDYGDARIGIAATDPGGILAHPVETVPARPGDPLDRIVELARRLGTKTLVLGLPVRSDGTEGTSAEKIRHFGQQLANRLPGIPLVYVDEYLTTAIASEKLRTAGKKAKNQRNVIDQAAAVEILNIWMEETNGFAPPLP